MLFEYFLFTMQKKFSSLMLIFIFFFNIYLQFLQKSQINSDKILFFSRVINSFISNFIPRMYNFTYKYLIYLYVAIEHFIFHLVPISICRVIYWVLKVLFHLGMKIRPLNKVNGFGLSVLPSRCAATIAYKNGRLTLNSSDLR